MSSYQILACLRFQTNMPKVCNRRFLKSRQSPLGWDQGLICPHGWCGCLALDVSMCHGHPGGTWRTMIDLVLIFWTKISQAWHFHSMSSLVMYAMWHSYTENAISVPHLWITPQLSGIDRQLCNRHSFFISHIRNTSYLTSLPSFRRNQEKFESLRMVTEESEPFSEEIGQSKTGKTV